MVKQNINTMKFQVSDDVPECLPVIEQVREKMIKTKDWQKIYLEMCECDRGLHHQPAVLGCHQTPVQHQEAGEEWGVHYN